MVGIVFDAATHSAGIVRQDATHHGCGDAGRIRTNFAPEAAKSGIDHRAGDARLYPYAQAVVFNRHSVPMLAEINEQSIRYGLSG